jgi:hypothetical protein
MPAQVRDTLLLSTSPRVRRDHAAAFTKWSNNNMRSRSKFPWQGLGRDARERTRLRLVETACEITVLTALMHDDLAAYGRHPLAREFKRAGWEHRRIALELLAPETRFESFTHEDLTALADAFGHRLQDVRYLRGRVSTFLLARKASALSLPDFAPASAGIAAPRLRSAA